MKHLTRKQKKLLYRIVIAGVIFLPLFLVGHTPLGHLVGFEDWPWYLTVPLFALPYLIAGYDVLRKAALNIFHGRVFDENFLMCIATLGAFSVGAYAEAGEVMLLYQLGEFLQALAVGKSRRSVSALMDIRPDYANLERDGALLQVSPEEIAASPLAPYFTDHTTGLYPIAASGVPFDMKYVGVKGDILTDLNEDLEVTCTLNSDAKLAKNGGQIVTSDKIQDHNTFENPDVITLKNFDNYTLKENKLTIKVPAKSVITLCLK